METFQSSSHNWQDDTSLNNVRVILPQPDLVEKNPAVARQGARESRASKRRDSRAARDSKIRESRSSKAKKVAGLFGAGAK